MRFKIYLIGLITFFVSQNVSIAQAPNMVVMIDPGHGGHFPGADGEKGLNLDIARRLKERLKRYDIDVEMTREGDTEVYPYKPFDEIKKENDWLYLKLLKGKKPEELDNKQKIALEKEWNYKKDIRERSKKGIDRREKEKKKGKEGKELVYISIHNNWGDPKVWGPQTYYHEGSLFGWLLASYMQSSFWESVGPFYDDLIKKGKLDPSGRRAGLKSDKETRDKVSGVLRGLRRGGVIDSALMEMSFLSNSEEQQLQENPSYKEWSAHDMVVGIAKYLNGLGLLDDKLLEKIMADHPDETFDLSSSNLVELTGFYLDAKVTILNNGGIKENSKLIDKTGHKYDFVDIGFSPSDVAEKSALIIPTGGLLGMSDSVIFKTQLEDYVKAGGVLIVFAQQHGYDFNVLPRGDEISAYGWNEDQNCQNASVTIVTDHPMFSGQTTNTPNVNVDGYFTKYPADATVLMTRTKNLYPAMLMYPYGSGKVIISSMYSDWAYGHGQASLEEIALVRDMISWAKNATKTIPTVQPGQMVTVPVEVKYNLIAGETQAGATKVKFFILDPDRNVIATQEQVIPLTLPSPAGGEGVTVNVTWQTVPSSAKGIWWIDYQLYDTNNNIVQPQTKGDRFAVATALAGTYQPGAFLLWATSDSYVAKGSQIVLNINVTNNTDNDFVNGSIRLGAHESRSEGGEWYRDIGSIPEVTIPAHSTRIFTYEYVINYSSSIYFGLYSTGKLPGDFMAGADISTERGVWVVPASVATTITTDKFSYKRGENVNINVGLVNQTAANYNNLTTQVRILDQNNTAIYSQSYQISLMNQATTNIQIPFLITEGLTDGTYIISAEVFEGQNRVGTAAETFEVQNVRFSVVASVLPSVWQANANNEVIFTIGDLAFGIERQNNNPIG